MRLPYEIKFVSFLLTCLKSISKEPRREEGSISLPCGPPAVHWPPCPSLNSTMDFRWSSTCGSRQGCRPLRQECPPPWPGMSSSSALLLRPPPPPRTQRSLRCPPGTRRFLPWESQCSCVGAPHPEDDPNSSDAGARVCVLPGSDREGPGRQASRAFHARGTYGCHSRCPAARPSDSILPTDGHVPGTVADEQLLKGARRRPLGVDAHRRSTDKDEDTAQAFGGFWGLGTKSAALAAEQSLQ